MSFSLRVGLGGSDLLLVSVSDLAGVVPCGFLLV